MTVAYQRQELSRPVARRLAMARASKGWTLKSAAEHCGVSISTIWAMENGTRCPSVALAGDVAKGYGLSTDDTVALMSEAVRNSGRDNPGKAKAAVRATASQEGE